MSEYVTIPDPAFLTSTDPDDRVYAKLRTGSRVQLPEDGWRDAGRVAVIVGWGRGTDTDRLFREGGTAADGSPIRPGDPEVLIDSEGPVFRFEDQDEGDETLHWRPGQSFGRLVDGTAL